MIPGWGRSPGEGIGYPLQYSWASLVAQSVNNSPAMWETWVQSLGWEDPMEKLGSYPEERNGYPIQYSDLENSMDRGVWQATAHGVAKSQKQLSDYHFHFIFKQGDNIQP